MSPVYYPFYLSAERNNRRIVNCPLIENDGYYTMDFDLLEKEAKKEDNKLLLLLQSSQSCGQSVDKGRIGTSFRNNYRQRPCGRVR